MSDKRGSGLPQSAALAVLAGLSVTYSRHRVSGAGSDSSGEDGKGLTSVNPQLTGEAGVTETQACAPPQSHISSPSQAGGTH